VTCASRYSRGKKFAYDIWGDTVNMASRMESIGEAGKVNISVSTFELVKIDLLAHIEEKFRRTIKERLIGIL
jgi:class 3 adenylate cyclase